MLDYDSVGANLCEITVSITEARRVVFLAQGDFVLPGYGQDSGSIQKLLHSCQFTAQVGYCIALTGVGGRGNMGTETLPHQYHSKDRAGWQRYRPDLLFVPGP